MILTQSPQSFFDIIKTILKLTKTLRQAQHKLQLIKVA